MSHTTIPLPRSWRFLHESFIMCDISNKKRIHKIPILSKLSLIISLFAFFQLFSPIQLLCWIFHSDIRHLDSRSNSCSEKLQWFTWSTSAELILVDVCKFFATPESYIINWAITEVWWQWLKTKDLFYFQSQRQFSDDNFNNKNCKTNTFTV